jgi:aspartate aminotransferase
MSPFPVSENVSRMQSSATMAAMQAAEALRAAGVNVCDFGAGEPDFDTPDNIKHAAAAAMKAGQSTRPPAAFAKFNARLLIFMRASLVLSISRRK